MNNFEERKKYFKADFNGEMYDRLLNMVEELIIAEISRNEFAMKDIYNIYNEYINDENLYMGIALETYDMMNIYLMNREDYLAPAIVMSLFAYSNTNNKPEIINLMLKKAFKKEYKSVETNTMRCDVDGLHRYKENIIYFYIASLLNVDKKKFSYGFLLNIKYSIPELFNSFSIVSVGKSDGKRVISEMSGVLNEFGINKNKPVSYESILAQMSRNKLNDIKSTLSSKKNIGKNSLAMLSLLADSIDDKSRNQSGISIKDELSKDSFKYFDFITSVMAKTVRCSKEIEKKELSSEELLNVLGITAYSAKNRFKSEELPQLFLIAFIVKIMGDIIMDYAKSLVMATTEKITIENDAAIEKEKIMKQYYKAKEEETRKQLEINKLNEELELLRKENSNLKAQLNKSKSKKEKEYENKKEIESLRTLFFELEHKEIEELGTEDKIYNDRKNIAFIGSNMSLHTKIKNMFPNFTYISANECSRDLNFIKKYDKVFIHTHIPHTMYYKVLSLIENLDIDLIFLNETNSEILGRRILAQINKS